MTTVVVNGKDHVFPPEMSQEEILSVLRDQYPPEQPIADAPEPAPANDLSFIDRLNQKVGDVRLDIQDTLAGQTGLAQYEQVMFGEEPRRQMLPGEAALQNTGALARGLTGPIVAGTEELVQEIDQFTGGKISDGFEAFMNSNYGQAVGAMFKRGGAAWENFKKSYPVTARSVGDAVEVGLLGYKGPQANKLAQKMAPADKIGGRGQTGENFLHQRTYKPNANELEVGKEVAKVPGIREHRSYGYNYSQIEKEAAKRRARLDAEIIRDGNPPINRAEFSQELADLRAGLPDMDEFKGLSVDGQRYADEILEKSQQIVMESDGTTLGLLQARRDLDRWVEQRYGDKVFDPNLINGRNAANSVIRQKFNQKVIDTVPNVSVEKQLKEQSLLLRGLDNFGDHRKSEALGPIKRFVDKVSKEGHVGPVGAYAVGSGIAATAGGVAADSLLTGLASGGLTWTGLLAMKTHERRRLVGMALQFYSQQPQTPETKKDIEVLKGLLSEDL